MFFPYTCAKFTGRGAWFLCSHRSVYVGVCMYVLWALLRAYLCNDDMIWWVTGRIFALGWPRGFQLWHRTLVCEIPSLFSSSNTPEKKNIEKVVFFTNKFHFSISSILWVFIFFTVVLFKCFQRRSFIL